MRRWLITGASGFLGANAGYWLAGRVERVGVARTAPPAASCDEYVFCDLLDTRSIAPAIQSARPDVVMHCAALASHEACEADPALATRVNVDATAAVAAACDDVGATLVYVSTDSVFDGARGGYRETDDPNPFSVYGASKLEGERAARESTPDALIVRTNFFGWSVTGQSSILEFFIAALRDGRTVSGYTDFVVTSIYTQHLMGALEQLVASEHRGVVHVASSDAQSKYAFGQLVAHEFGLGGGFITPVSAQVIQQSPSRVRDLSLNTGRMTAWLGSSPPGQRAGIDAAFQDESRIALALRAAGDGT